MKKILFGFFGICLLTSLNTFADSYSYVHSSVSTGGGTQVFVSSNSSSGGIAVSKNTVSIIQGQVLNLEAKLNNKNLYLRTNSNPQIAEVTNIGKYLKIKSKKLGVTTLDLCDSSNNLCKKYVVKVLNKNQLSEKPREVTNLEARIKSLQASIRALNF